jgi:hypothetical protein
MRNPLSLERRSNVLLISIVAFLVIAPILEGTRTGGFFLTLILYVTLASATLELAAKPVLLWSAIPMAVVSMVLMMVSNYHPTTLLREMSFGVLAAFLLLVWVSLFAYLERGSNLRIGKLSLSVSLYFVMGLSWFAIYSFINEMDPGAFAMGGAPLTAGSDTSGLAYYSFVTLTTLGYGDIVPVHPVARMAAALEAVAGVLYIAITVSRLVAAYQSERAAEK